MKYQQIAQLLRKRIEHGDYTGKDLPSEIALAQETGVSRMTARKALLELVGKKILVRQKSGRLICNGLESGKQPTVALLTPAWSSSEFDLWRMALERCAAKYKLGIRRVDYVHWDDPAVVETLNSYRGVFLFPGSEDMPDHIRAYLLAHPRLVVLGKDFSRLGILSVYLFPEIHLNRLLDLLRGHGHKKIDCLNIQPMDDIIEGRIRQWRGWLQMNGLKGDLLDGKCAPFSEPTANAYQLMTAVLDKPGVKPKALLCLSINCAFGAVRACVDNGLTPGKDIEICAVNGQGMARYLCPSVTCLEWGNPAVFLDMALQWVKSEKGAWSGPLLLQPDMPTLFLGETTAQYPKTASRM